jgi:hypothetical protein
MLDSCMVAQHKSFVSICQENSTRALRKEGGVWDGKGKVAFCDVDAYNVKSSICKKEGSQCAAS